MSILGNLTVDLVIRGVGSLPSWGTEVAAEEHETLHGGQAYLLARALARLDIPVGVVTVVGDDDWGRDIVGSLDRNGVRVTMTRRATGMRTSISVAIVRADGERAFVSDFGALRSLDDAWLERSTWPYASGVFCLVGLFNLPSVSVAAAARLLGRARAQGMTTMLDTGWDPAGWSPQTVRELRSALQHVDLFLPNDAEATALSGSVSPDVAARAFREDGAGIVVIKRGPHGAYARGPGAEVAVPAIPVDVVDTVGAGDVFDAGFLYAHLDRRPLPDALRIATATAAAYVSRSADRFPVRAEVEALAGSLGFGGPGVALAQRDG